MIVKTIHYTSNFVKKWKKLTLSEKNQYRRKIEIFQKNPFDQKLKTHKLKGKLARLWSFSLSYENRVLFSFKQGSTAIFYDFGSHEVYK